MYGYNPTAYAKDLLVVRSPAKELAIHVTFKTIEIGAFIGGFIVNPIYCHFKLRSIPQSARTPNTPNIVKHTARRLGSRCLYAG